MTPAVTLLDWLLTVFTLAAAGYALVAAFAPRPRTPRTAARDGFEPVSVLKPLCGAEPHLYENLATFCEQRHPRHEVLFGVASAADPAIAVVERLRADYPECDITLVVDARVHGKNLKVSNLINLAARAKYGRIVIADSDIAVKPDYLERVTAPLADASVGVVTCLYHARSVGGFWTRIGAQFVDAWFAPSVRITHLGRSSRFGFGATLALTRDTLDRIGGFAALKDELADDFWLAELPRRLGRRTVLSEVEVATDVIEPSFGPLWHRETRWLRTIRSLNPAGFAFLFITFTAPWLAIGAALALRLDGTVAGTLAGGAAVVGAFGRLVLHARGEDGWRAFWRDLPLVAVRDTLLALEWLAAVFGTHVVWRGARMTVVGGERAAAAVEGGDGR
ncbi:ceramide glucosyltransferase [Burkholderia territorii]|uniref:bacteriohopanetetrol glucosamine biosynthesis glycosyltransferase HpnI n=1 Tax=Burkholderia territorii TaxID=1503055 RepID=UPI00075425DC|nr:bacteriohopanetetrol glucosamine biosynthesis glycosyltransferase HpnI [Burkholderia territorii]AOI65158.1 ceramide glucosyltransferase [Burkholderia territorii]KUZ36860.1 ceramide glucosyltransferase [Burkholderia territorii]KUZ48907.1 ceramide glucosyltransferase [Burkholderia territorii]KVG59505.1 ceramide glucosyltransferase [Burkholderia territorii]KVL29926.1 ceramide glucosyltransferase [Burkholderia territorii]